MKRPSSASCCTLCTVTYLTFSFPYLMLKSKLKLGPPCVFSTRSLDFLCCFHSSKLSLLSDLACKISWRTPCSGWAVCCHGTRAARWPKTAGSRKKLSWHAELVEELCIWVELNAATGRGIVQNCRLGSKNNWPGMQSWLKNSVLGLSCMLLRPMGRGIVQNCRLRGKNNWPGM